MKFRNSKDCYGVVHQLLHWGMAALVGYTLYLGLLTEKIPLHKMLGVTVLLLAFWRLVWRWADGVPEMPAGMGKTQKKLAETAHFLLYFLMVAMPVCGWVMSNAAGYPVSFWGIYELPALVEKNKEIRHLAGDFHEWGGWLLLGLIGLHILAALQHQFVLKDGLLWRMLPFGRKRAIIHGLTPEEKKLVEKAPWT